MKIVINFCKKCKLYIMCKIIQSFQNCSMCANFSRMCARLSKMCNIVLGVQNKAIFAKLCKMCEIVNNCATLYKYANVCNIYKILQNVYTIVCFVKQLFELCKLVYLRMIFLVWNTTEDFTIFFKKGNFLRCTTKSWI